MTKSGEVNSCQARAASPSHHVQLSVRFFLCNKAIPPSCNVDSFRLCSLCWLSYPLFWALFSSLLFQDYFLLLQILPKGNRKGKPSCSFTGPVAHGSASIRGEGAPAPHCPYWGLMFSYTVWWLTTHLGVTTESCHSSPPEVECPGGFIWIDSFIDKGEKSLPDSFSVSGPATF